MLMIISEDRFGGASAGNVLQSRHQEKKYMG